MPFSHKPVVRLIVAALIAHLAAIAPAYSGCGNGPSCSMSLAESIENNRFICNATVSPARFNWRGHDIQVRNAWVEKSFRTDEAIFCIDFYQDGRRVLPEEVAVQMVIVEYPTREFYNDRDWSFTRVMTPGQELRELFGLPYGKVYRVCCASCKVADGQTSTVFGRVCTRVNAQDWYDNRLLPTDLTLELKSELPITAWEVDKDANQQ